MFKKIKTKVTAAFCVCAVFLLGFSLAARAAGALTIALSSSDAKVGDTVTVTVYAAGADNEAVIADLNLTYDAAKLEYVSSSAKGATGGGGTVKASGSDISIRFKAIASGDAYVKAEGAALTAAGAHIAVSGSSASEESGPDAAKSGDNSLSSLTISSGTLSPAFKGSVTEYTAQVGGDVSEITVNPVLSNSKAEIVSVSGNKDLKEGKNVITVLVRAENGQEAAYKITVTKGGSGSQAPSGSENEAPGAQGGQEEGNMDEDGQEAPESPSGDGTITIDGARYTISEDFTEEDIPEGFTRTDFEYKGEPYQGVIFDYGHLGMYYMESETGERKFFIYDADRDKFYPYVRLSSGEHFIILMVVPNGVIPPERYEEATLTIGDAANLPAYRFAGPEDKEIVKTETESGEMVEGEGSDFYIFYGMDRTGVPCWYQYDAGQGTYQRLNVEAAGSESPSKDYETLAKSYKELDERQRETKAKDRRNIAILIFISVALLILIINLLLKVRELKAEDDDEEEEKRPARPARIRKQKAAKEPRPARPAKPSKPAKPAKQQKAPKKDEDPYYFGDDDDMLDDFEDEPGVFARKLKKKERPQRRQAPREAEPAPIDEEDDIEFIDLNDL